MYIVDAYAYLPRICFFRSASKDDMLWSLSGGHINLNWICRQTQIGFVTFLFCIFTFFCWLSHQFQIGLFTFSLLHFSLFLLALSTVSNWIFTFLLSVSQLPLDQKSFASQFFVQTPNQKFHFLIQKVEKLKF